MKYLLLSFLFISIIGNSQVTTTIDFEDNAKWIAGSGLISSYQIDHQYNDGVFSSTATNGLRNGNAAQDGFAAAIGNYSWRIRDVAGSNFVANIASGGVSSFSLMIRRWDASPQPNCTIEYMSDGSNWIPVTTVNNTSLLNQSGFVQFNGVINSSNPNIKIKVTSISGERVMIDNFVWTDNSVPSCETTSTISPSACVSYESPSGNYTWTVSNTYKDTIPNAALCDSVITVNLTINQPETVSATATICAGQTYSFGTQTLTDTDAGPHTEVFQNINTCDSTVNLTLTVVAGFNETATATICEGETYVFGSQNLTASGPYTESFTSIGLCDSTVNLTLTVIPRTYATIPVTECDSYTSPSGKIWTISNTYNDTIPNAAMCDSVITVNLTIKNSTSASISESVCGSYDFLGNTLTSSGVYMDTIPNTVMCDSIITLTLDITPIPVAPTTSNDSTYCENVVLADMTATGTEFGKLIIAGVMDGPLSGGTPKAVEFYAIQDIADLSIYGFGSANNGDPSSGPEFTFPALSLTAGDRYYVALDSANFNSFFGFNPNYSEGTASNINGDDVVELFKNGVVIDVFGELGVDGTNTPWDYTDGWAYRKSNSWPNGGTFEISEWTFSGTNQLEGGTTNGACNVPYPIATMTVAMLTSTINWYSDVTLLNSIGTGNTLAPSATNGATTYYVTETITGATSCESPSSMVTITINTNPTVTFSALSNICENASDYTLVEGSPAGGVYSGTGVTSGVFSPSTAGAGSETLTYTYTDVNDCSADATQSITIDAAPNVTFSAIADICEDGADYTLIEGAPSGGTYSGAAVTAGVFSVATAGVGSQTLTYTYSNANCTANATQSITVNATPNVTFSALSNICENASDYTLIEGVPSGGTYSGAGVTAGVFSPSAAGVGTETLTYDYTDGNNCSASATQSITIDAAPAVTFGALATVCVYNPTMALTGGLPAGGTYSGPGVSAGNFDPSTAGNGTHIITYTYTNGNGCDDSATSSITVDGCASIDENNSIGLSIFPNPTNGLVTIQFEGNSANITVIDIAGKTIGKSTIHSNETIDLSPLNAGTYFIILNIDGKTSTERVIIK